MLFEYKLPKSSIHVSYAFSPVVTVSLFFFFFSLSCHRTVIYFSIYLLRFGHAIIHVQSTRTQAVSPRKIPACKTRVTGHDPTRRSTGATGAQRVNPSRSVGGFARTTIVRDGYPLPPPRVSVVRSSSSPDPSPIGPERSSRSLIGWPQPPGTTSLNAFASDGRKRTKKKQTGAKTKR